MTRNTAATASIQDLLTQLVRTPSQALADDLGAIVRVIRAWLDAQGVAHTVTGPADKPTAIVINPSQPGSGEEVLVLNACVDTAPAGDLAQWRHPPFAATVHEGWLYGRGSADSKAAVAIFCHLAKSTALTARGSKPKRRVSIVFDCDEHSGRFGGIRAYTQAYGYPAHCAIGYPGLGEIVNGSRGFFRCTLKLRGEMGHSGAAEVPAELATDKLQQLLAAVSAFNTKHAKAALPDADFPLPPRATVTGLRTGARTHSVTAAMIECLLDIRLTPAFDAAAAQAWLDRTLAAIERRCGAQWPSKVGPINTWPPYRTPPEAVLPQLLQGAAAQVLGTPPPLVVCGPSNIGNLLAGGGTQVLCGFGVDYRGIHGADECVRVDSIRPVYETYRNAVRSYLAPARPS